MPSHKQQFLVWTIVILSALAIGGYFYMGTGRDHKPLSPPEKILIAYSATPNAALIEVAKTQDFYRQEGLEATLQVHSHGKTALQAVLEGKADFATVAETPFMFAVMKGEKISIIGSIEISNNNIAVVARKDKGVLIPSDLKGKRIAMTPGTSSDFFMDGFLVSHGLRRKDIKVVDLKPEATPEALLKGEVDAVSIFNPYLIQVKKKLGAGGVTFCDEDIYSQTFNVVAKREFIRKEPGKVQKILRALIRAEEFVKQNPGEAQRIVADFCRLDIALVREIWPGTDFTVGLDQSLLLALEDESRWAINSGLTEKRIVPNYLDFICLDNLMAVKPKAVRILK